MFTQYFISILIKIDTCRDSSEKVLEEDAYKNDEGIPYSSRRRRKKKTATYVAWSTCLHDCTFMLFLNYAYSEIMHAGIRLKQLLKKMLQDFYRYLFTVYNNSI